MKKGKKMLGFVMSLVLLLNLITINVQASTESNENFKATAIGNVNIISTTNITVGQAQDWARSKGATEEFIGLAPLYEKYSQSRGGVNWAVAYVQAAKETGYGRFGGVLDSSYHNPCGLKNSAGGEDDDPNAHKKFDNWEQGVIAHLDHLALYAGADGYPKTEYVTSWTSQPLADNQTYDPRHLGWYSTAVYGKCKTVNELGGNWAPSSTYGVELFRLYCDLTKSDYLEARSNLETPINNATINENSINIVGWALHAFGVKEVNVSIDNVSIGKITEFSTRNDVSAAYPGYFNGNQSGFNKTMDISSIQDGTRTLLVEIVANNGSVQEISRTIKIARANDPVVESLPTVGRIDEPADGAAVTSKTMTVRGWALAGSGVKEVRVLVDGKLKATTNTGLSRPDIGNAYPKYSNASNAGFQVNVDISDIANGTKTITAEVVGNDGSVHKLTRNIKVNIASNTLATVGRIDEPADGAAVTSKTMTVRGWALAGSGVKEVRVLVDGKLKATTNTGLSRPDIGNAYPKYSNASNAGFQVNVDISDIANGTKTITAEVVGNDGSVHKLTRNIKVNVPVITNSTTLGRIDEPVANENHYKSTIKVRGWAINESGISEVRVYVNGTDKGKITYGTSRPDVNAAYPGYPSGNNSGYESTINISDIAEGKVEIKVVVTAKDGTVKDFVTNINLKGKSQKLVVIDPGHENPGGDPGSTATHNGITYIESNLNLQIAVRLKNELESRGIAVVMTRSEGSGQIGPNASESLRNRVKLANDLNADFFISLHHNSGPASAQGFEVWYSIQSPTTRSVIFEDSKSLSIGREIALSNLDYKISKSRELAEEFTKTVSSSLGIVNRGAKYEPIGVPDYYVTKNTNMPSVIVENGFLTNANEAKKVSERTYQQKLAEILANIISNKL